MILNDRKPAIILAIFAAIGLVIGLMGTPGQTPGFIVCHFKLMTGMPCPGCGMTRALISLLHGDLATALWYHPFVIVAFPGMLGLMAYPLVQKQLSPGLVSLLDRLFIRGLFIVFILMLFYNAYRWYVILTAGGYGHV